jgi:hypothetical protein
MDSKSIVRVRVEGVKSTFDYDATGLQVMSEARAVLVLKDQKTVAVFPLERVVGAWFVSARQQQQEESDG